MKVLLIFFYLFSFSVKAETVTGVIFLKLKTEEEIEPKIRETMELVKRGHYRGPGFKCNGRGKVYAVEVPGLRYRADRDGNVAPFFLALLKYRCK